MTKKNTCLKENIFVRSGGPLELTLNDENVCRVFYILLRA